MKRTGETKTDRRKEKCMKRALLKRCVVVVAGLLVTVSTVWAEPNVEIKIKAEKETTVVKNGKNTKKMFPVKKVISGDTIQYTLTYRNSGTDKATNAVISDPIPEGTVYVPGTASEVGELSFSIDGGKSFKKPALLTYEMKGAGGASEKRTASPEEYTHIRWVIDTIQAGASGNVSFKVKVK